MTKAAEYIIATKKQIKELEANMAKASNLIKEALKSNEIAHTPSFTIKWSPRMQSRVDTELLKTEYPETYLKVVKSSSYRVMSIKGGKEAL